MNIKRISDVEYQMTISKDELSFVAAAILESIEAVPEWEYHARVGLEYNEAKKILELISQFPSPSNPITGTDTALKSD
jgi:hypothetical protein